MTDPLAFALAVLALLVAPGPTNTLLVTSGAIRGFRSSLPLLGAALTGYIAAILVLHGLLGALVHDAPAVAAGLRAAVVGYLIYVSVRLWVRPPGPSGTVAVSAGSVLVTTLLNPKAVVFAFVVIPFTTPWTVAYLAGFSATTLVAGASWIAAGAWLGRGIGGRHPRLVPRASAVVLCAFAAGMVAGG